MAIGLPLKAGLTSARSDIQVFRMEETKTMTANERIVLIEVKIERAKKHISDLESEVKTFFDSKPYKVGTKRDPQVGKLIYYIVRANTVPDCIAAIAGDAIHNLRSVLDHIGQHLFLIGPNRPTGPQKWDYFIIGESATDFESKLQRKIKDFRPDAIDVLRSIEPYQGGKGHGLWVLHRLDIVDKHRLLVTVGSSFQSVDLVAHMRPFFEKMLTESFGSKDLPLLTNFPSVFFRPADNLFPLKAGDELFIDAADAEVNEKMQFRFNVALNEPGITDGKPLLETIHHLADLVSNTFLILKPCLS
ncbi:MAG: hypothetical protein ACLP3B_03515 [Syntrophobacteraceae bacterium]